LLREKQRENIMLDVTTHTDIVFAEHDGTALVGDLYLPQGTTPAPVLIGVHGGGWQLGNRKFYTNMGAYLAANGFAVFAIEYRLMAPGVSTYPGAVYDVRAAIQFVRAKAGELGLDPERIGLVGDSAGAHLASLAALAGSEPAFATNYKSDPYADVSPKVKAVVGVYGVYDMLAQWQHDLGIRPRDNIAEKFLGAAPSANRAVFFEASPISYTTVDKNAMRVLLIYGTDDDVVDPATQSAAFLNALKAAGFFVRAMVIPGAGHYFFSEPVDDTSFAGLAGPRIVRFLKEIAF
jgi:acetyl esterase/lipase